jgi:hypothetical protein
VSKTITIAGTDRTAVTRLDSLTLVEAAYRGEVGIGGLRIDDASANITISAMKSVTVTESAASPTRLFTGYTHKRTTRRGPNKVAGQREWDVELLDVNILASDFVLSGSDANRGAETDYIRVSWLLTTVFNTIGGVTAGVVPNSNTADMDAVDYRGRTPRDVLDECSEMSGKNWFIYHHSSGPLLFYDMATGTNLSSTARISDVAADVDNSTVFAPQGEMEVEKDPDDVFSTVRLKYKRGTVTVTNATTATNFRRREKSLTDLSVKTSAKATAKANRFLTASAAEKNRVSEVAVRLPMAKVNDIRAGQRIQIKLTRHGISSYTYYRILRRKVEPLPGSNGVSDVEYLVTLSLADVIEPTIYGSPRGGEEIWEEKSNATDDGATVIVDAGGITVTNGAITVTNGTGTVIIDGSSEIFLIAASGTLTVPRNTVKGDVFKTVDVNTGLTYHPHTVWSITLDDGFIQPLPEIVHNLSGQILKYFTGHARHVGSGVTRVRGLKGTTNPPLDAKTYKYWIYSKQAF